MIEGLVFITFFDENHILADGPGYCQQLFGKRSNGNRPLNDRQYFYCACKSLSCRAAIFKHTRPKRTGIAAVEVEVNWICQ